MNYSVSAIILAAGSSLRFGENKLLFKLSNGRTVIETCVACFEGLDFVSEIIVVTSDNDVKKALSGHKVKFAEGGKTRQLSAFSGAGAANSEAQFLCIHDGARPFVDAELIKRCVLQAIATGACIPVIKVKDTVKFIKEKQVERTLKRDELRLAQTPQIFDKSKYFEAFKLIEVEIANTLTDDSQLFELAEFNVYLVEGSLSNIKITTRADILIANSIISEGLVLESKEERKCPIDIFNCFEISSGCPGEKQKTKPTLEHLEAITEKVLGNLRIGQGYDVHRLVKNRALIIGGVKIEYTFGLLAHSDGDVLTHAIMDAMLGAVGLRDIGYYFPNNDEKFKDANSMDLLKQVVAKIKAEGCYLINLDAVIMAEEPKFSKYIAQIKNNLAQVIGCESGRVNVKATTEEGLGFTGEKKGIAASAVVLIRGR